MNRYQTPRLGCLGPRLTNSRHPCRLSPSLRSFQDTERRKLGLSGEGLVIVVSIVALLVSLTSLLIALDVWLRTARPLVAVAVKTHRGGNQAILYNLVVLNSGAMPAKNVRLIADAASLASALGSGSTADDKRKWLACFDITIPVLLTNDKTTCSFGTTQDNDSGFWKYGAVIDVEITYNGRWCKHRDKQHLRILDTDSFTGNYWAEGARSPRAS